VKAAASADFHDARAEYPQRNQHHWHQNTWRRTQTYTAQQHTGDTPLYCARTTLLLAEPHNRRTPQLKMSAPAYRIHSAMAHSAMTHSAKKPNGTIHYTGDFSTGRPWPQRTSTIPQRARRFASLATKHLATTTTQAAAFLAEPQRGALHPSDYPIYSATAQWRYTIIPRTVNALYGYCQIPHTRDPATKSSVPAYRIHLAMAHSAMTHSGKKETSHTGTICITDGRLAHGN